ncbi:hypothetical protein AK812_SmicGene33409 [Symbiodinium microadriaticum]|uniref:Uncharacterized protein n=1 Tax=Symbiodinium microadriaticum TaxID=2951 RepID=A0A1Q9CRP2_SYMMI|nr:hypothetical protein AK812_SmicGene33409 [Symbiodinium microadriaticum]
MLPIAFPDAEDDQEAVDSNEGWNMDEDDRLSISWEGAVQLCTQPWCTGGVRWIDLEIDEEALRHAAARQQELLEQPQDVPPLAEPEEEPEEREERPHRRRRKRRAEREATPSFRLTTCEAAEKELSATPEVTSAAAQATQRGVTGDSALS